MNIVYFGIHFSSFDKEVESSQWDGLPKAFEGPESESEKFLLVRFTGPAESDPCWSNGEKNRCSVLFLGF